MINDNTKQAPDNEACVNCGGSCSNNKGCRCNLASYDWLGDVSNDDCDLVEVHFKNTRRGFYRNSAHLELKQGDWVAVEAQAGHDVGQVALTGPLVKAQMQRVNWRKDAEILRVFRKAKAADMERYEQAKAREQDTMIRSRKIAVDLGLKMKIGDVEYQGDGNKAIFYYIADERVDFRQLIKVLADTFKIRVEMKQIGARQEAGRIGGIGPCGRPLCCATWMSSFVSVATSAARFQDISLNPQNLAGQCAKLKCCINFEVNTYVEAIKQMPAKDVHLETKDATYYYFKADVLKREITYSTQRSAPVNLVTLTAAQAFEVIALNRNGVKPDTLKPEDEDKRNGDSGFSDLLSQDSISRFDRKKHKKRKPAPSSDNRDNDKKQATQQPQGQQQRPPKAKNRDKQRPPRQQDNTPRKSRPATPTEGSNRQPQSGGQRQRGKRPPRNNSGEHATSE